MLLEAVIASECAFLLFWSTLLVASPPDQRAHVYLSWSMVWEGNAELSEFRPFTDPGFHEMPIGDKVYAPYLPGNALLFSPLALIAGAAGLEAPSHLVSGLLPRLLTSFAVAFALFATHLCVAVRAGRRVALYVTFALAFGTAAASVGSQVFYEHGTSMALLAAGIALSLHPSRSPLAGLPLGLAVLVRPTNLFAVAATVAALAHARPRSAVRTVLWMAPAAVFLLLFNWLTFGSPLRMSRPLPDLDLAGGGVLGLLMSPSRGMLVYSPFLVVALVALVAAWRWRADQTVWLLRYGSLAFVGTLLVFGTYAQWWGGTSFGDRYLSDLLPLYGIALGEAFARGWIQSAAARIAFAIALGVGVLIHLMGMGMSYLDWDGLHWAKTPPIDDTPWRLWSWAEPEWLFYLVRLVSAPPVPMLIASAALIGVTAVFMGLARAGAAPSTAASPHAIRR